MNFNTTFLLCGNCQVLFAPFWFFGLSEVLMVSFLRVICWYFIRLVRYDGISSLPADNRYGLFPGASAGWTISNESFMEDVSFISDLKVRGSYAEVGNTDIGNYPYLGLYSNAQYANYNGIAYSSGNAIVGNQ
ncbi:MAG: TonB-dependent receptor [Draconibacterium sp.]|nr:TonB-dependent receptor [Draconibacterium sp.]